MPFSPGQTVWRKEVPTHGEATVALLVPKTVDSEEQHYWLYYAEGGQGGWPEDALTDTDPNA